MAKLTADTITDRQIRELRRADLSEPAQSPREIELSVRDVPGAIAGLPPLDWLTGAARDAVKIAVSWAGFDAKELTTALAMIRGRGERLNAGTVYRVMGAIMEHHERARCAEILNAREGRA